MKMLSMRKSKLGESSVKSLETAILADGLTNLESLDLSSSLPDNSDINGKLLSTFLLSIASHCPHLNDLDLSKNNFGSRGAVALGEAFSKLMSSRDKLELNVNDNKITGRAAEEFAEIAIRQLGECSCKCELDFGRNPLGNDGLLAIFKLLMNRDCPITELDLGYTALTTTLHTESHIYTNLTDCSRDLENNTLATLYIYETNLSGDWVYVLAQCIQVCKSLETLWCSGSSLTSESIITLLSYLKSNGVCQKHLQEWDLRGNSIDNGGAYALIENLPELFPCLESVDLDSTLVSDERLKKILKVLNLKHFTVHSNCFSIADKQGRA